MSGRKQNRMTASTSVRRIDVTLPTRLVRLLEDSGANPAECYEPIFRRSWDSSIPGMVAPSGAAGPPVPPIRGSR